MIRKMQIPEQLILIILAVLVIFLLVPAGYYWKYKYYYVRYLDWDLIDEIFENPDTQKYFRSWGKVERYCKTKNPKISCPQSAINHFKKNIRNFTEAEKNILSNSVRYLRSCGCRHQEWKFVKIHSDLEFGYPFTLGDYMFIPHRLIENAVKDAHALGCGSGHYLHFNKAIKKATHVPGNSGRPEERLNDFVYLILHERIHVYQRKNIKLFKDLYRNHLDFISVPKSKIVLDSWTEAHRVTNPDGCRDIVWLTKIEDHWYLPMMILDSKKPNHKPHQILIHMVQKNGIWSPIIYLGKVVYYKVHDKTSYVHRYYLQYGLYDPNEIVAYIAADLLMGYKIAKTKYNLAILDFIKKHKIM